MEHEYWEEKLQGYIDHELGPADRLAMDAHIDQCPDCRANLNYFQSLKRRLQAHAETVCIPKSVDERIHRHFEKRKKRSFRPKVLGFGLAMAAALAIGFFLPRVFQAPYRFETGELIGHVVCHDCMVAKAAGVPMGELCINNQHQWGLQTDNGTLWRFAHDKEGLPYIKDIRLYGKKVKVFGQMLEQAHLLRIKTLETLSNDNTSARLRDFGP